MINLLPPAKKEELFLEQVKKMILIFGCVSTISLICFTAILLSIKFYILGEIVSQKATFEGINSANLSGVKIIVQKYNKILPDIKFFYEKESYISDALTSILKIKTPAGVYLSDISLSRSANGTIKAIILGVSDKRENLITFKNNIEADRKIKNSQFSPDSWIKESKVNFYLTLDILNENKDSK